MNALLVKTWDWLTISDAAGLPLPAALIKPLVSKMSYKHVIFKYGPAANRVDPVSGARYKEPVTTETRELFYFDRNGLLNAPSGFLNTIWRELTAAGVDIKFIDQTGDMRPEVFVPDWANVYRHCTLRNRQDEALQALLDNYGGVINAAPGFGKSFMLGAAALLLPKAKFAIVTRQRANVQGLVRDISKFVPVGQIGMSQKTRHRVTVYSAASLHLYDGQADIMIGDEGHQLVADGYASKIMEQFKKCRRFTCTATPKGRADQADIALTALFGDEIFYMSVQEAQALGLIVPIRVHWHSVVMDRNPVAGKTDPVQRAKHGIWRNQVRNQEIARAANQHPDEQVLILVEKVDHAVHLKQYLPEFTLVYGKMKPAYEAEYKRNGLLPQDFVQLTPGDLIRLRDEFTSGTLRKVIATDVWSTGVSFESLAVLIRADARSSPILDTQIPGRVSRIDGNKSVGILHDFLDQFDNGYRARAGKRAKNYAEKDWEQVNPSGLYTTRRLSNKVRGS